MEVRVTIEVLDGEEVLYEKKKRSIFNPEPHYDRMLFSQISGLNADHKQDIKLERWFEMLKQKR